MGAGGPRRGEDPPDGGWGWAVLGACFVVTGFAYGFPKAVSVFFRALMRDFGAGYSDTAWVSSIMLAMLYGTGPVSSILVARFGCRPVMLVGGLLASAGMVLASFATRLLELYLTAGVLTGLGLALNFQPSLVMLGLYFDRRRPLANGLAAAGSPVVGVKGGVPRLSLPPRFLTPGYLVDALKNYEIIFYLAGSEVVLAGVFMAVATHCCLRSSQDARPSPGTEGGASDTEDPEAEGDFEPLPTQPPGSLEALEVPSPGAGPLEPKVEAESDPGLDPESV
ncbi:PREDICTED: monocarboxylate transporter 3 [Miniopterus natalensis]|uniref:monocarboxylate transporter 3 n=1 Tax=Miniopterus natalensis TaxID=291302 RepID=UPI0007A6DBAF|nr:PREDICTED: monocarboxylate transporter 3 [Miniopterus natalensis]